MTILMSKLDRLCHKSMVIGGVANSQLSSKTTNLIKVKKKAAIVEAIDGPRVCSQSGGPTTGTVLTMPMGLRVCLRIWVRRTWIQEGAYFLVTKQRICTMIQETWGLSMTISILRVITTTLTIKRGTSTWCQCSQTWIGLRWQMNSLSKRKRKIKMGKRRCARVCRSSKSRLLVVMDKKCAKLVTFFDHIT